MDEVVFNHHKEYLTTEEPCGYWIDGKVIYRKTINFGALPNATTKQVAHNISDIENVIKIEGYAIRSSTNEFFPLPFASTSDQWSICVLASLTTIDIICGADRSSLNGYVTLYYTKVDAEEEEE